MSQRRQKKQLTVIENVSILTDQELREALKRYNQAPGPITDSTRNIYRQKLASLMDENHNDNLSTSFKRSSSSPTPRKETKSATSTLGVDEEDDDDTSDEDYIAHEEEESADDEVDGEDEEGEDDSSTEDDDDEDDEEELMDELKMLTTSSDGKLQPSTSDSFTTSMIAETEASATRTPRALIIFLVSFFVAIFSFYIYSRNDLKLFIPSQPFKSITRQLLILIALSPIGYSIYRTIRFLKQRRDQEMKRVCNLVNDALELLQSPDNPKGMMPILHIRDTLLTPAERKSKKTIGSWTKAVKFIEEHESRVKVELVNIDGEDFRAWKWIGSRKI